LIRVPAIRVMVRAPDFLIMKKKPRKKREKTADFYAAPILEAKTVAEQAEAVADAIAGLLKETHTLAEKRGNDTAEKFIAIIDKMNRKWAEIRRILLKSDITWVPEHWYMRALFQLSPDVQKLIGDMAAKALQEKGDADDIPKNSD
jgi:hypothetical protein